MKTDNQEKISLKPTGRDRTKPSPQGTAIRQYATTEEFARANKAVFDQHIEALEYLKDR